MYLHTMSFVIFLSVLCLHRLVTKDSITRPKHLTGSPVSLNFGLFLFMYLLCFYVAIVLLVIIIRSVMITVLILTPCCGGDMYRYAMSTVSLAN